MKTFLLCLFSFTQSKVLFRFVVYSVKKQIEVKRKCALTLSNYNQKCLNNCFEQFHDEEILLVKHN